MITIIAITLIFLTAACIVVPVLLYPEYFLSPPTEVHIANWGSFGDYFSGTVATGLTLVTVILVWATYRSQRKELEAQKIVLSRQTEIMEKQAFEQTFFSWLEFLKEIRTGIDPEKLFAKYVHIAGGHFGTIRTYMDVHGANPNYRRQLELHIDDLIRSFSRAFEIIKEDVTDRDNEWFERNLINLEAIINFVNREGKYPELESDKMIYFRILSAQFSRSERYLLGLEEYVINKNASAKFSTSGFLDFHEDYPFYVCLAALFKDELTPEFITDQVFRMFAPHPPRPNLQIT